MSTIRRSIIAGALALPMSLGTVGVASAADFSQEETQATPNGVVTQSVEADDNGDGVSYEQQSAGANENGAWHEETSTSADGDGGATFHEQSTTANENGVTSNETSSNIDGDGNASFNQESVTANQNGVTSSETSAGTDDANEEDNEGGLLNILG